MPECGDGSAGRGRFRPPAASLADLPGGKDLVRQTIVGRVLEEKAAAHSNALRKAISGLQERAGLEAPLDPGGAHRRPRRRALYVDHSKTKDLFERRT
jgi:hypothetical protein